jgi:hypothetical protein
MDLMIILFALCVLACSCFILFYGVTFYGGIKYDRNKQRSHIFDVPPLKQPEYYMNGKKAEVKPITKEDIIEPDLFQKIFDETKMLISQMVEIENPYIEDCELDGKQIDGRFTKVWVLRKELEK